MSKLEIIETTKRKPSAILDGYQYRKHRTNKEDVVSWLCVKEKTEKCRGTMKTCGSEVLSVSEHICLPNVAATEVKKNFVSVKKRMREEEEPTSKIYSEEIGPLFNRGYEFVTEMPTLYSVRSSLNRIRRQAQGNTVEPVSAKEINLPEEILQLNDGTSFLLFDNEEEEDRFFVFSSSTGKEALAASSDFFIDGTFKSCSKQFKQIYTIHADIGSTTEETNIIPIIYALLNNKTRRTYEKLFNILKNIAKWNPETVSVDFEHAAIAALKNVFPSVSINGCNFHFNQCLWRKIQELGLATEYKENEEIRLRLRMCAALAYLPTKSIEDGWLSIQEDTPDHPKLVQFYDYFVEQWLENSHITLNDWNCNNKRHRTNNAVEGWNNKLNTSIKKNTPTVKELIKKLKEDAEFAEVIFKRKELNLDGKRRKKKYVQLDARIKKTLLIFENTKDVKKCLKTMAFIAKFE